MTTTFDASPLNLWVWGEVVPASQAIIEIGKKKHEGHHFFDVAWKSKSDAQGNDTAEERFTKIEVERKDGVDRLVRFGSVEVDPSLGYHHVVELLPEPAHVDISSVDAFLKSVNLINEGSPKE